MNYLGIDSSTQAIHCVVIDDKERLISTQKFFSKGKRTLDRFPEIMIGFFDFISTINNISSVAIEDSIQARNGVTTKTLARVVGGVHTCCVLSDIETVLIHLATWKKEVIGRGNATKLDILEFATEKWGNKFPEQDYADAACVALWNKRRTNGEKR